MKRLSVIVLTVLMLAAFSSTASAGTVYIDDGAYHLINDNIYQDEIVSLDLNIGNEPGTHFEIVDGGVVGDIRTCNIAIVTIDEPFYLPRLIKKLIETSSSGIKFVLIIIVPVKPKKFSSIGFLLNQLSVMGFSQFLKISTLYGLRKFSNVFFNADHSVEKIAKKNGIPVIKRNSLKSESLLKKLNEYSLDIILSIASTRIFNKSILALPKIGCLNVHAGMLPKYRGINPSFWSLLNGEKQSAVSIHFMTEKIDDGDILKQDKFEIENVKTLHEIYLKLLDVASKTIVESLIELKENKHSALKNDSSNATYYSFPTKEDGQKFRKMGFRFM